MIIERALNKRSKELIPKINQTRLRLLTLQGAMRKESNIEKIRNLISPLLFRILGAPILFPLTEGTAFSKYSQFSK